MTDQYTSFLANNLTNGVSLEETLAGLRARGATPVEVIKAIRDTQGVSLGEAKQIFGESAAWARESLAADALHEKIISEFGKEKNP